MVDTKKLLSQMVLQGYTQKRLVEEINARGVKISENTFSKKMNGESSFDCNLAIVICDILNLKTPRAKSEIFLA